MQFLERHISLKQSQNKFADSTYQPNPSEALLKHVTQSQAHRLYDIHHYMCALLYTSTTTRVHTESEAPRMQTH